MAHRALFCCFLIVVIISDCDTGESDLRNGISPRRQPQRHSPPRWTGRDPAAMDESSSDGASSISSHKGFPTGIFRNEHPTTSPSPVPTSLATTSTPICNMSEWSSWSKCDCRNGVRHRKRAAINFPKCASKFASEWEVGYCPKSACLFHEWMNRSALTTASLPISQSPEQPEDALSLICGWSEWLTWSACNCHLGIQYRNRAPLDESNCIATVACSREIEWCRNDSCLIGELYSSSGIIFEGQMTSTAAASYGNNRIDNASERSSWSISSTTNSSDGLTEASAPEEEPKSESKTVSLPTPKTISNGSMVKMGKKNERGRSGKEKPTPGIERLIASTTGGSLDNAEEETPLVQIYDGERTAAPATNARTDSSEEVSSSTIADIDVITIMPQRANTDELTTLGDEFSSGIDSSEEITTNQSATTTDSGRAENDGSSTSAQIGSTLTTDITTSTDLTVTESADGSKSASLTSTSGIVLSNTDTVNTSVTSGTSSGTTSFEHAEPTEEEEYATKSGDTYQRFMFFAGEIHEPSNIGTSSTGTFTSSEPSTIWITSDAITSPSTSAFTMFTTTSDTTTSHLISTLSIDSTGGSPSIERTTAREDSSSTDASTSVAMSSTTVSKPSSTVVEELSSITTQIATEESSQDTSSTVSSTESTVASSLIIQSTSQFANTNLGSTVNDVTRSTTTSTGTSRSTPAGATEEETTCEERITTDGTVAFTASSQSPRPSTEEATTCDEPLTDEPVRSTTASSSSPTSTTAALICTWSHWSPWSSCECRTGYRHRQRSPRIANGCLLLGCSRDVSPCRKFPCKVDCVYGQWSCWSKCEGGCDGQGSRWRFRHVRLPGLYGGKRCQRSDMRDREYCKVIGCGNCDLGDWTAWTECRPDMPIASACKCPSLVHGNREKITVDGHRSRERTVMQRGNLPCPLPTEEETCTFHCCM